MTTGEFGTSSPPGILAMFEDQAGRNPEAVAVAAEGETLTYGVLEARANQLARFLTASGVEQDAPVGLCLPRSLDMPVAVLGILKAGAAIVPLDPSYPQARRDFVLQDAGIGLVVTQQALRSDVPPEQAVVCLDTDWPAIAGQSGAPVPMTNADGLCYIIYTSGSTGTPKGVALGRPALSNLIAWQLQNTFARAARTAQFAALSFDVSFQEIFATLCGGGTLVLVPEPLRQDPRGLVHLLDAQKVERLFLPFVALQQIAEEAALQENSLLGLREVITAGEQLKITPAIRALFGRLPHCTLHNQYGPSETHVATAYTLSGAPDEWPALPAIGWPVANMEAAVLDEARQPVPDGAEGELYLGGVGLAQGYYGRPDLTADRFLPNPFRSEPGARLYKTGDRVRRRAGGALEFLGRMDAQVKIRGFRVEPGEVEPVLLAFPSVRQAAALGYEYAPGDTRLIAYLAADGPVSLENLRRFLEARLAEYLVPSTFVLMDALPLTPSGKVDRLALPAPRSDRPALASPFAPPAPGLEQSVAQIWEAALGVSPVGALDSFFDLGGRSLQMVQVHRRLSLLITPAPEIATLFQYPTVRGLVKYLTEGEKTAPADAPAHTSARAGREADSVAIVGMAGRFPGARDVAQFWENIKNGVESITHFTDAELEAAGTAPDLIRNPDYTKARGVLEDPDLFDAGFFGISPKEADVLDPQHRIFLECAWEALEHAGCDPENYAGSVGVWAGTSLNTYLLANLCGSRAAVEELVGTYQVGNYPILAGNDKDFLPTRVSYKLGLTGPSMAVGTGCSTSLVAVAQACQSLRDGGCDMALAGGVSVTFPQTRGYLYQEGGMVSPDGHCRAFDAEASGTVFGGGAGVVALKRLADAVRDGDTIHAVIKGYGLNNDGAQKASYTAPSADGQAGAIRRAHAMAGVSPETITYAEAHGTATPLGDPIEIAGLTKAFRAGTDKTGFCALGSVKTNVGHLEAASGVTGLIKTALALSHKQLPPSLHFETPNPRIDFANSPFIVNAVLRDWPEGDTPRRAGVSSFGVGGTNAHVVLEEAPPVPAAQGEREGEPAWHLLPLSARTETALETATANLARHLRAHPETDLTDAAATLQSGRRSFAHRRFLVCRSRAEAVAALEAGDAGGAAGGVSPGRERSVAFLFPGQGAQQVNMGRGLYEAEPGFRAQVDECCEILLPLLGLDLRETLYPRVQQEDAARTHLAQTGLAQPALFVFEYALARLWMGRGVSPQAMLGHSVGEYVAACLAGVFTLRDALAVLAGRARLMQTLPPGAMLAVRRSAEDVRPLLGAALSLAAVNSPSLCVVSGPDEDIRALEDRLTEQGTASRRLATSHAFHSAMTDPILVPFQEIVAGVPRRAPQIPFLSNVSGTWITDAQATDPAYWAQHLRQAVRFQDGVGALLEDPARVLLEVGPGSTLGPFARQHPAKTASHDVIASLDEGKNRLPDSAALLGSLGRLWIAGVSPKWERLSSGVCRRIPLPTYPFERTRHWVEPVLETRPETRPEVNVKTSLEAKPIILMPIRTPAAAPAELSSVAQHSSVEPTRADRIREALRSLLHEQSGLPLDQIDPKATFLDLGFDSLSLTQASTAVGNKFGVKVTFRTMLEDAPTAQALADFLDQKLPPEAMPSVLPPAPPTLPAPVSIVAPPTLEAAPVSTGALERVIADQLQVMAKQLELLRGGAPAPPSLPPTLPAPAALPTPVVSAPTAAVPAPAPAAFGPYKPIDAAIGGGLTPHQQQYLESFVARYAARTPESKRLTQLHRPHLADPRAVAGFKTIWKEMVYPIVAARSAGAKLWDVDGHEYIDVAMGFGVNLLGHSPAFITDALTQQLKLGVEIGPQSLLAGEVARLACEMTGMERATFCNTGSEAVMAAMRAARTVTGRTKIVYFTGDYHGTFDEVLARASGSEGKAVPVSPGIPAGMTGEVLVLDYGTPETLDTLRRLAPELAAVLVEPVQSRRPDLQPREFLHEVRRITEDAGAALIFDEVITGFRVHPGGAQAWFGIKADLATYGKIVGGGMPIGLVVGKAEYMDAFDGGSWDYGDGSWPEAGVTFFAGTFVRHPLALAAAKAMLEHLKAAGPALQEDLNARTARFVNDLNVHFTSVGVPIRLANFGSLFYFKFAPDLKWASLLFFHLRQKGIHIWEGRPCFLSTAHTDEDVARLTRAFQESVAEMQEGGFLPGSPAPAINSGPRIVPLTEPQREVWLASQRGADSSCALIESLSVHLEGEFQPETMQAAVQQVVDRHEALRTTFPASGDSQEIHPALALTVPFHDLSGLDGDARAAAFSALVSDEGRTPFDLVNGPLFRARIIRLDPRQHVLVLTAHHLVCDGWSSGILLSEIGALYAAGLKGEPGRLLPPSPFHLYAEQQSFAAALAAVKDSEEYWKGQLSEDVPSLDLPTNRARAAAQTFRGGRVSQGLDPVLVAALARFGSQEGSTLFTLLFSGFAALLQRLSGQDEVIVGVPAAGQSRLQNPRLVGHCVSLLPVRLAAREAAPFREFLRHARGLVLDAYDHQDCTLGHLLQAMPIAREPGRPPLVAATFNLDRLPPGLSFGPLAWTVETNPRAFYQFDFGFNVVETAAGLTVECDYNADLFDRSTMTRWIGHFETLLRGAVQQPECSVQALPLLSDAERRQVLCDWSRWDADLPPDVCVHTVFEAQAEATPDAAAVEFGDARLTYRQLNARANQLAHRLRDLGIGPDKTVGVLVERSLEMVVALLACLKAGGAYVPMDPVYPLERLQFMLDDARPFVVLAQEHLLVPDLRFADPVIRLDTDWDTLADYSEENLPLNTTPDSLVYVIYTSGSTGKPKGVAVPHRGVVRLVKETDYIHFGPDEVFMQLGPLSFDASTFEVWGPLLNGGRLLVMPAQTPSLQEIGAAIRHYGITTVWMTAGLFHAMVDHDIEALRPLRQLIAGGDFLSVVHCRRVVAELPDCRLVNGYGPTECTTFAVCHAIKEFDLQGASVPIGVPISNTTAYILDMRRQPVPIGVEGELWLGGAGLAREYINRADLTQDRFAEFSFERVCVGLSAHSGEVERLYATGDRARWRPDGVIEFFGRRDGQVKIRGFRVEFGEIEQALLAHPAIGQAVVIAQDAGGADKKLVAYVVSDPENAPTAEELAHFAAITLPAFLIPSAIVFLPALPLTRAGKPDRKALPALERHLRPERAAVVQVHDALEQDLIHIWQEILGVESVGLDDDFFELGGHSLLALRLFGKIEKLSGVRLPFPAIFQAPTIRHLAARIRQGGGPETPDSALVPIQPQGSKPPLFCVHPDHGLVLFYHDLAKHLAPERPVFGLQATLLTPGQSPDIRLEDMAARYVRDIRAVQPLGPYRLAGYSLGGVIAFEMAQQLRAAGQEVPFLGLLDTYAPIAFQRNLIEKSPLQRVNGHLSLLKEMGLKEKLDYLKHKTKEAVHGKKDDWQIVGRELKESLRPEQLESLRRTVAAHEASNSAYQPKPYAGKVTLFRAVELDVFEFYDPHLWWSDFCAGGLEVRDVPGSHWTIMKEPFVATLADSLRACLERSEAEG